MYKILRNPGIAQRLRDLLYKINDLGLISGTHTKVEGANQLHKEFFGLPHEYGGNTHTELPPHVHTGTHTQAHKETQTQYTERAHTHHTYSNTKTLRNNKILKMKKQGDY